MNYSHIRRALSHLFLHQIVESENDHDPILARLLEDQKSMKQLQPIVGKPDLAAEPEPAACSQNPLYMVASLMTAETRELLRRALLQLPLLVSLDLDDVEVVYQQQHSYHHTRALNAVLVVCRWTCCCPQ